MLYLLNISFHQLQGESLYSALDHHGPLAALLRGLVRGCLALPRAQWRCAVLPHLLLP